MARVSSKKSLKRGVKPMAIDVPDYSGTNVKDDDLVLINRSGADYNTSVEDLAEGIGASLELDSLVNKIQTEIDGAVGDINTSIDGLTQDLSKLEVKVDQNTTDIGVNADGISDNSKEIAKNKLAIGANTALINVNKGNIETNKNDIATNTGDIDALKTDQDRQNSWTGIGGGTNSNANLTHDARIKTNADAISRLQGALVFRGSADVSAAPAGMNPDGDAWKEGDFIAAQGDVGESSVNGAWNATGDVKGGDYFALSSNGWAPAGSNATVIPDINDGSLTISAGDTSLDVSGGTGFSANTAANVTAELKIKVDGDGGLVVGNDGIGINVDDSVADKNGVESIIISGDGISVNPDFIQGIAGPVPNLQAVTGEGATTDKVITTAGVVSTGDQSASTFLHKDISKLPQLS